MAVRKDRRGAERWALGYTSLHNLGQWMRLVHSKKDSFKPIYLSVDDVLGRSPRKEDDVKAFHAREWSRARKRVGKMLTMKRYLNRPEKVRSYAESRKARETTILLWAFRAHDTVELSEEEREVHQGFLDSLEESPLTSADDEAKTYALVA